MVYSLFSVTVHWYEQAIQPCCYVRFALKQPLSLASHLQVIARGRDLSVIFPGEYHS